VVDTDNHHIFVADSGNHRIMRWNDMKYSEGGICIAGVTGTLGVEDNRLDHPVDVTFDKEKNLIVSDCNNHRVQRFDIMKKE
jgi:DNA-binding beta-propeller fold protein YncE